MSRIRWECKNLRTGEWYKGYVGDVAFFHISPWKKDSRPGWELNCTLPEHRAEDLYPYDSVENAQGYCEEILKNHLRKSGLQFKPTAPKTVPPAVRRVERFLNFRAEARQRNFGSHHPELLEAAKGDDGNMASLTVADLEKLVKLAKKNS